MGEVIQWNFQKSDQAKVNWPELKTQSSEIVDELNASFNEILDMDRLEAKYAYILESFSMELLRSHISQKFSEIELPELLLDSITKQHLSVELDNNGAPSLVIKLHLRKLKCVFPGISSESYDTASIESHENIFLDYCKLIAFTAYAGTIPQEVINSLTLDDCIYDKEKKYIEFHFDMDEWSVRRIPHSEITQKQFWEHRKKLLAVYWLQW